MKESRPQLEQKNLIEVVGNLDLIRKKLTKKPGFAIAFLLSNKDFKIYVSPDNSHVQAAKMARLPSNMSKDILIKGRISPQISTFLFNEQGKSPDDFLRQNTTDSKAIDKLVPEVVNALKDWLGKEFKDYETSYKKLKFNRPPESIA